MPDFNGRESYTSAPGPRYVNNKRGNNKSHSKKKTASQNPKKKGDSILNMQSNGYTLSNPDNNNDNMSHTNDNLTVDSRKIAKNFDNNKSPQTAKANMGPSKRKFSNKTGL